MGAQQMPVDPDAGIPDLIYRLRDDSKRLLADEVQLAKLEMRENVSRASKGALWFGVAFGAGVIAMIAGTLFLITLIGRLANGHMWLGAIVTGVVEIALAVVLVKKGLTSFAQPSYSFEQTRASLAE